MDDRSDVSQFVFLVTNADTAVELPSGAVQLDVLRTTSGERVRGLNVFPEGHQSLLEDDGSFGTGQNSQLFISRFESDRAVLTQEINHLLGPTTRCAAALVLSDAADERHVISLVED